MAEIEFLGGVREVPREAWNALVGNESPFLEWEWLASLEEAGTVAPETGWAPRPLVVRDRHGIAAACPLYLKGHSAGEFVFDHGWADAAERAGIRYYPKLLAGVPFTPVTGARILVRPDVERPAMIERIGGALRELCTTNEFSGVHVNFCRADEIEPLRKAGFRLRVGLQYHWQNHGYQSFDDYLARFRSKRRNQIRRERRAIEEAGVTIRALVGDEIPDRLMEPMYRLYLSTIEQRYWGRQYLNYKLFELLGQRFRKRLCFVVAERDGELLAGTFNVYKGEAMYGRYWGAFEYLRHLHFNVCYYAAADHCIRNGLARFEPGAGGEYKQLRGFDAQPTYSLHYLADARLDAAVGRFLEAERSEAEDTIDWMRDHSQLKAE